MLNKNKWSEFRPRKYNQMFLNRLMTHQYFKDWLKDIDVKSGLEIGGGLADHKDLFKKYHNIEINETIKNSWTTNEDYMKYKPKGKPDLIFSHAVIDHNPTPNEFILKSIKEAKKYVFHSIYRGLQRQSRFHLDPIIDKDNYLYNQLSEFELKDLLKDYDYILRTLQNKNVVLIVKC